MTNKVYVGKPSKLYVGNLTNDSTEQDLLDSFGDLGTCRSVKILRDKNTGCSRGFAFVEMADEEEARNVARSCNRVELNGQKLIVIQGRPMIQQNRSGSVLPGQKKDTGNKQTHRG